MAEAALDNKDKKPNKDEDDLEVIVPELAEPPAWFTEQKDKHIHAPKWDKDNALIQTFKRSKFEFELQVFYKKAGNTKGGRDKVGEKDQIKMILKMPD